jgi:hypothetical protein
MGAFAPHICSGVYHSRGRRDRMLRLLEVPLDKSQTAEEAAEMLQRVFESHFREDNGQPKRKRKLVGAQ